MCYAAVIYREKTKSMVTPKYLLNEKLMMSKCRIPKSGTCPGLSNIKGIVPPQMNIFSRTTKI
jgi:hypothetical protein